MLATGTEAEARYFMAKWRWISVGVVLGWVGAVLTGSVGLGAATIGTQATPRVFELRTYTAQPGKFDGMKARFREHIIPLFKRHNLTVVGFWTYADPPASQNTLVSSCRMKAARPPRRTGRRSSRIRFGSKCGSRRKEMGRST
jgi:hypothetical protein